MSTLRPSHRPVSPARRDRAIREALSYEDYVRRVGAPPTRADEPAELSEAEWAVLRGQPAPLDVLALVGAGPVAPTLARLARLAGHSGRVRLHVVVGAANRDLEPAYRPDGGSAPVYVVLDARGAELGTLAGPRSPVIDELAHLVLDGAPSRP